jgi:16S rRNA (adenine1518-N6/adenine1519-N6)-dimethyltransferase
MTPRLVPLKRFGQNFLTDKNILHKIFSVVLPSISDVVLEIGPGDGAMTFSLAAHAKKVLAVEIDKGRYRALKEKSKGIKNLEIRQGDFLTFDLPAWARRKKCRDVVVVANIPYYITTPILERLFGQTDLIRDIYVTVQKEVGERLVAKPGAKAYSALTCFAQYFTNPEMLFPIKAGSFWPAPKVDSCFVRLRPYRPTDRPWKVMSEEMFFKVIRAAFGQRRKMLASSLTKIAGKEVLLKRVPQDLLLRRPETLSLHDFAVVANQIP